MSKPIKSRIVQVGISQNVEIEVRDNQIAIVAASKARVGWDDAFARMVLDRDELEPLTVTDTWDETEWVW